MRNQCVNNLLFTPHKDLESVRVDSRVFVVLFTSMRLTSVCVLDDHKAIRVDCEHLAAQIEEHILSCCYC